jgi:hypothetical protein
MKQKIIIDHLEIVIFQKEESDYISLTDIAKAKNPDEPDLLL